jgi:hypothetical protein
VGFGEGARIFHEPRVLARPMELIWRRRRIVELCHVAFPFLGIFRLVLLTLALSENGVITQADRAIHQSS